MANQNRTVCRIAVVAVLVAMAGACGRRRDPPSNVGPGRDRLMTSQDLSALPSQSPDQRIAYGPGWTSRHDGQHLGLRGALQRFGDHVAARWYARRRA
jgi:hypothetical protein